MKRVVSVSIGSSTRNHSADINVMGEKVNIERIGTDGNLKKCFDVMRELDGQVDAFGLGGTNFYLTVAGRKYPMSSELKLAQGIRTPIVDGSNIKGGFESRLPEFLAKETGVDLKTKKVLLMSAVDRYALGEALEKTGCQLLVGDFYFALGIPIALRSLTAIRRIVPAVLPLALKLPFGSIYPTGKKQEEIKPTHFSRKAFDWADVIAGDFHYIRRYMSENLKDKVIVTNTVTPVDKELLSKRGAALLLTASPDFEGRSFATNVLDALVVAVSGKRPEELGPQGYQEYITKLDLRPRFERL
ncbi:MAG TPA: quinate 5-dehydrogenase [Firmicutes bacterium]|nr:quinate 5-dehydrogenase [Bacillota bacterium]HAW69936.1 quinate 5-dehydrogenase [Bacillota bacterium]HAZ20794.1 quinate 5-dehydrogenase [Bacillota bacterium]HBE05889.1 quinate 5-dehydrogenase [Bacillota bacterium]HBG43487.1 quinate 5-dehydrogenase [Bacillota bacterium]